MADDLDFDPDQFLITYPLWVCVRKDNPEVALGANLEGGHPCIPVFTDEDLATRFRGELGVVEEADIVRIPDAAAFAGLLGVLQKAGVLGVFFDDAGRRGIAHRVFEIGKLRSEVTKLAQENPPMSAFPFHPDPVPLRVESGTVRVGATRILLDLVVEEFENGASPEDIVNGYPTLDLADVYSVIGYYLRHREAVDRYLSARQAESDRLRQEIEATQPGRSGLRAKLLARRAQREQAHASPGK